MMASIRSVNRDPVIVACAIVSGATQNSPTLISPSA